MLVVHLSHSRKCFYQGVAVGKRLKLFIYVIKTFYMTFYVHLSRIQCTSEYEDMDVSYFMCYVFHIENN